MKILFQLLLLLTLALTGLSKVSASETRVDSTGGLSLVMTDETSAINPFNFGNPAGLSLLPAQSRFDIAAPWFQETPAGAPAEQIQAYGSLSQISNNFPTSDLLNDTNTDFKYQGLIFFPTSQWAFQASGDLLHANNQVDPVTSDEKSVDRARGMARTSYNFGPFSLGTEIDLNQTTKDLPSSGPDGQGNASVITSTSGLLMDFPLDSNKNPAQLRLGGNFTIEVPPAQEKDHYSLMISGNPLDLDFIYQSQSYTSFGPEIYLDVPDLLQAAVITRFSQSTLNYEQDSSNNGIIPSIAAYELNNSNSSAVIGLLKTRLPLAGTLRQKLSLNTGGYILVGNNQSTNFDITGTTLDTNNLNDLQAGIGIGVENSKDFTVGLQATLDSQSGSEITTGSTIPTSFFSYVLSVGGERWLSAHWAFRMGATFEDDYNGGTSDILKPYYAVPSNDRVVTTTLSAGLGFEDSALHSDFMLWTGQPSLYNSPNPDEFATQVGLELAVGIIFN